MNTCKTCKNWDYRQGDLRGTCQKINLGSGWDYKDKALIHVFVADDSGLDVEFRTTADFGCNLYEVKA